MIRKTSKILTLLFLLFLVGLNAQSYCVTGCNSNTYVDSEDPNTLEYDNIVSSFHNTIVREKNGGYTIWGQGSATDGISHLVVPTALVSSNNFNYTGSILKATTAGGFTGSNGLDQQHAILTTTGLYIWGTLNALISPTVKTTTSFGKITVNGKADGLPAGVSPTDVKMMFGSSGTLAIVTCSGQAWVLSRLGNKNGDGSTDNNGTVWHRVSTAANTPLTNVVAMRGAPNALFALTSTGLLYTWGTGTFINSGNPTTRTYATLVTKPAGVTPKMIGMTQRNTSVTYYLLATSGKLYAMGDNSSKQVGDGTTSTRTNWTEVTAISGSNVLGGNITWISPKEHDYFGSAYINVITKNYKQWAWGGNEGYVVGGAVMTESYAPIYMPGNSISSNGLQLTDEVMAVESGGHIVINLKKCSQNYGYLGHQMNGSLGNGLLVQTNYSTYTYNTAMVIGCNNDWSPTVKDLKICSNTTANLNSANLELNPALVEWHETNDVTSPVMTNIIAVGPGIYYAFYTAASGKCRSATLSSTVTISYYPAGEATCNAANCYKPAVTTGTTLDTHHGITSLGRAGTDNGSWPMIRKGAWTALEAKTKGFVINRIPTTAALTAIANPVEGMMVYDEEADCLKIYSSTDGISFSWKCFITPACPD